MKWIVLGSFIAGGFIYIFHTQYFIYLSCGIFGWACLSGMIKKITKHKYAEKYQFILMLGALLVMIPFTKIFASIIYILVHYIELLKGNMDLFF